ncbi:Predicted O-methyltransferase YrrM [Actinopolyspora lacussalsi subsp. righensis]|uniref:Predicted O-methyltransferase YrrM n=1 Tax=Actinopolyspora righensis TaxID=995060 RepID=A0A1I7AH19_9ACTN|nr:class I SAM-dependent methyltransferase [Actinopolyspora righensis]SFT74251.1 Predicted O-methyltransferase YrrM [Actinopolyspora righensis]
MTDGVVAERFGSPEAMLRFLASALRARAAVEVAGSSSTALALCEGMIPEGTLTCITLDTEAQRTTREAVAEAGLSGNKLRMITGVGAEVLPRLAEDAYDLVHIVVGNSPLAELLELATPLLRPGATLLLNGAFRYAAGDRVFDPDGGPQMPRDILNAIHADPRLVPVALPIGSGLLAIART